MERRTILGALEAYRRIKSAEKKLVGQREANAEAMEIVFKKYDKVIDCVVGLQERMA